MYNVLVTDIEHDKQKWYTEVSSVVLTKDILTFSYYGDMGESIGVIYNLSDTNEYVINIKKTE